MNAKLKKFKYWFEENILSNINSTIIVLLICTLIFTGIVTIVMFVVELVFADTKQQFFTYYCDNLFTAINAWYPEIPGNDGIVTWKNYVFKVIVALFGIFFTSVVIGLISEKISNVFENIRNRNRKVIENNHFVVLGYTFGECKVIEEIIASTLNKTVIVIADNCNKEDIFNDIIGHLNIPKNVKLIIQSLDITDYNMLEYCSIEDCKAVIINTLEDNKTVKIILAVSHIISKYNKKNIKIISAVKHNENILPYNKQTNIVTMLSTQNFIVRFLARVIKQKLLYESLIQLMSFKGVEFYFKCFPEFIGKNIEYVYQNLTNAILIGILRGDKCVLALDKQYVIKDEDVIVYISNYENSYEIINNGQEEICEDIINSITIKNEKQKILIIGYCDSYEILLNELCIDEIYVIGKNEKEHSIINEICKNRKIEIVNYVLLNRENIEKIVLNEQFDKIVLLSNDIKDDEDIDVKTMLLALHLRDLRRLNKLDFQLVITLNEEKNRELIDIDRFQTTVVAKDIVYMFLAQMAINFKLKSLFIDILSKNGINIDIIDIKDEMYKLDGINVGILRKTLLNKRYIYLGHVDRNNGNVIFDLDIKSKIALNSETAFLVIKMG